MLTRAFIFWLVALFINWILKLSTVNTDFIFGGWPRTCIFILLWLIFICDSIINFGEDHA